MLLSDGKYILIQKLQAIYRTFSTLDVIYIIISYFLFQSWKMTHARRLLRQNRKNFAYYVRRLYSTDRPYSTAVGILEETYQSDAGESISGVKPYSSVPGPKCLPIIGNSWRFAPIIGKDQ